MKGGAHNRKVKSKGRGGTGAGLPIAAEVGSVWSAPRRRLRKEKGSAAQPGSRGHILEGLQRKQKQGLLPALCTKSRHPAGREQQAGLCPPLPPPCTTHSPGSNTAVPASSRNNSREEEHFHKEDVFWCHRNREPCGRKGKP